MLELQPLDVEKIAFDHIEYESPATADLLLVMAARQVSIENLIGQLQGMALKHEMILYDFDIAVAALIYARRYLKLPITSH